MSVHDILVANEKAIDKWVHPPKFSKKFGFVDWLKYLHDTKRYFIINEISCILSKNSGAPVHVLDFGSGHGGISIDIKTYFGDAVCITGYEVSPKAIKIAQEAAKKRGAEINFILDEACDLVRAVDRSYDAVVSCDVFGHVPSIPDAFSQIKNILKPGGRLIAFSETLTGKSLLMPTYLAKKGFQMDDSETEHISLFTAAELDCFLRRAGFDVLKFYPYDPIRFPFYPRRYLSKLRACNFPLFIVAFIFSLFQNRITEIAYNQFNLFLSKRIGLVTTAGCLFSAEV